MFVEMLLGANPDSEWTPYSTWTSNILSQPYIEANGQSKQKHKLCKCRKLSQDHPELISQGNTLDADHKNLININLTTVMQEPINTNIIRFPIVNLY